MPGTKNEKNDYGFETNGSVNESHDLPSDTAVGEAADLYGNVQLAEEMGYVHRGLKSRHIQFIALGGTIGTGLFLGIGKAFATSGPLSVLLGYTFTGIAVFGMMQCLGEMATWLPLPGAIPQYCTRYVDPAMGFAVGWNSWYQSSITLCAEISAAAIVISFWNDEINPAIWISILIVIIIALNIFAVAIYGEAEFVFASVKIITIVGLLILALILDLGGGPTKDRLGFRYWKNPGAMKEVIAKGDAGRFLGLFSTLVNASFSYGGVEMVAVAAGEAENPRKNIPKAVKRVFWRILFFYCLGSLAIGVLVPSNDKRLTAGGAGAASSPWVIAIYRAGIPVLPSIINAVILTSAASSGNAFLYTGSRYLFGIAQNKQAPQFLLKCSKGGVPIYAVGITASISLLTYLSVSESSTVVFEWFQNLTTIAQLFTWCSICIAYLRFYKALEAQGVDRNTLVFKSVWQPYTGYCALGYFVMIIIFNGWKVFTSSAGKSNFTVTAFLTAYVGIPIFFGLYAFWRVLRKTSFVNPAEADIWSGKAALDAEVWHDPEPRNFAEKVWFWIA
ncbi:Mannose-6-phosphate isomerase [Venturia nashicola]|uniref:Mannose-6-phosphate isomerase n=1 Tax=Venturia nashicola TaxID=86259 RepID=A0A4Z1PAJ6_9PEZI|nr:Mannose-6-phosphate isomerase [Venturia nashicola]TLD28075.1 Mannose-6-phosphate isomerase [Venturia nashicola]